MDMALAGTPAGQNPIKVEQKAAAAGAVTVPAKFDDRYSRGLFDSRYTILRL
jgi:hypothetical protein